ncbi:bifunctional 6-phosphofructo-2-kinase/fructose-2,6-bisphosphate 2-phosphatase [Exidia glandulosa HHB12029]|uniref:Bifunctional 6-phosphofructo-2-kinase/fructose-2,6-bisphosphate 2-phosphatase n=1 Tax=Exidia glandulosa HHB12029 TaxID=1314781 RepID=A0A165KMT0_EXIGL|nr:bifunctional 6-phosphofructo-2-kinase/fructose-2,6-bisphosphate 2-phosphatase [Exidia glandulosa HHB12029]
MVGPLFTTDSGLLYHAGKIIIIAVGLPARGKTHICRALERYLRWSGVKTQVISLGDYRRKTVGGAQQLPPDYFTFGKKSAQTAAVRKKVKDGCEQLILDFFDRGGQVAIYDANNGTRASRKEVAEKFEARGIHVVFLESVCNNNDIIEANIRSVKISSPDYRGWLPEKAVADYWSRIRDHEKYYEPVEETEWPFIRIFDVGDKIIVNRIQGYLQTKIIFFLMNIHNRFRVIYFARSGQSLIEHSYKADSDLSPAGWEYAEKLKQAVMARRAEALKERGLNPEERRLVIWTSTRLRSHHTAWPFVAPISTLSPTSMHGTVDKNQMLEINPGVWDGLSPEDARRLYPEEFERFVMDPYTFRAPRAESYHDLSVRLEPTLIELEREQEDLLIIGHASVIRCLLAYLIGLPASEVPAVEVARGDLIEVVPTSYGVRSQSFHFWSGPGRSADDEGDGDRDWEEGEDGMGGLGGGTGGKNFYENYAEDTSGKRRDSKAESEWEEFEREHHENEKGKEEQERDHDEHDDGRTVIVDSV